MPNLNEDLWFGSEASYTEASVALAKIADHQAKNFTAAEDSGGAAKPSVYLSVVGGVGLINVEGPLVDATLGELGPWVGLTGYGDIAQAAVEALRNPEVSSILLNIRSGGGAAHGCQECSDFLVEVDKLKPVVSFTGSMMASAALWLGVSARKVFASETAVVGSVGAMSLVVSRAESLKTLGLDVRVIRSAENKALGHQAEPITEKALEARKAQVVYIGDLFLSYVAERRGLNRQVAMAKFGDGSEFIGAQAKDVGLVDGVMNYVGAFSAAKSFVSKTDNKLRVFGAQVAEGGEIGDNSPQAKGQTTMPQHIPSAEQLAALMAQGGVAGDGAAAAAAGDAGAAAGDAGAAAVPTVETLTAQITEATASIQALTLQLTETSARATDLEAQLAASTVKATSAETQLNAVAAIVRTNLKGMAVAMNSPVADIEALAATDLAEKYTALSEAFQTKYKAGGAAATTRADAGAQSQASVQINPLFLAAAKLNKSRN